MKSLFESILDVDTNIDELEIPAKPKVTKDNYPAYEQAWYNTLESLLNKNKNSNDYAIFFKIYKEWLSDWVCCGNMDEYFEEYEEDIDWYVDYVNYVRKNNEIKYLKIFLDDLIDECKKGAASYRLSPTSSGGFLYAMYDEEDMFSGALAEDTFSQRQFASSYKKFKSDIDKVLKVNGVKF